MRLHGEFHPLLSFFFFLSVATFMIAFPLSHMKYVNDTHIPRNFSTLNISQRIEKINMYIYIISIYIHIVYINVYIYIYTYMYVGVHGTEDSDVVGVLFVYTLMP